MKGIIIDKSTTDAFITLHNGDTIDVPICNLPKNVKTGDSVDVSILESKNLTNDKLVDFF